MTMVILRLLVNTKRDSAREMINPTARLLLAHLIQVNKSGLTGVDVWIKHENFYARILNLRNVQWNNLPNWHRENVPAKLSCLCASVIRSHKLPYLHHLPITFH